MRINKNYQPMVENNILDTYLEKPRVLAVKDEYLNSSCPAIAEILGDKEAIFIQKLHYWLTCPQSQIGTIHKGLRWIYNTYESWLVNFRTWSLSTLKRIIAKLEKLGVIINYKLCCFKQSHP